MIDSITTDEYNEIAKQQKRPKYGNRRVKADGYTFDSAAEHRRYCELKLMVEAGEIVTLIVHPPFDLEVYGHSIGRYTPDFWYIDGKSGRVVVEDVKGVKTRDYILRKKLIKAIYGIDIVEIGA